MKKTMTPKDRILTAMQLRHPDRVPLMCQFSFGFMNLQLKGTGISPMEFWLDAEKYAEGLMILRERFCFDGILVSVHGHAHDWRSRMEKLDIIDGVETALYADRKVVFRDDDLPSMTFNNNRKEPIEIIDVDALPEAVHYIPSTSDCHVYIDPEDPYRIFDILEQKMSGAYSIHGEITSPLDYLLDLLGYEQALLALLMQPEKCKMILQKFTAGVIHQVNGMCKKNIDAIKISSPFAGMGFIAPDQYIEFELPFLRQITNKIADHDKYSYIHTCGHIDDRLEFMRDTGTNGLECLDPPPIGNVDLADAFRRIGSGLFIKGNIDPVNTLYRGSREVIRADVCDRLMIGKNNPGFLLSTACSIAPKTPAENVKQLFDLVEEFGYYSV
jgi:uroporphyrinogen-III decarboxylase